MQKICALGEKDPFAFKMQYQPILFLKTGQLYGYEALCKPEDCGPETFVARAAKTGILLEIETSICNTVAEEFRPMQDDFAVFINLTPESYSYADGIVIMDALSQLKPERTIIELTEMHLMPETICDAAKYWKKKGYRLAIDDVSSGYSRLAAIAELEPDFIKIDRRCIKGAIKSSIWENVLECIATLSERINAEIIGEGIETEEEINMLKKYSIRYGQGYYFSRPVFASEVSGYKACS